MINVLTGCPTKKIVNSVKLVNLVDTFNMYQFIIGKK